MTQRYLVLGATGSSGNLVVRKLLETGSTDSTIVLFARSPEKLPEDITANTRITCVKGQLDDAEGLRKALEGVDTVISSLGPGASHPAGHPIANGYSLLIKLIKERDVDSANRVRLVVLATASAPDPLDKSSLVYWSMVKAIQLGAPNAYHEIIAIARVIKDEGGALDWTLARVPILTNSANEKIYAGYIGDGVLGSTLSRAGLAAFFVGEAVKKDSVWIQKAPMICSI